MTHNTQTVLAIESLILCIEDACDNRCGYCPFHIGDDYHMFCLKSSLEHISKELEGRDEYSYFNEENEL